MKQRTILNTTCLTAFIISLTLLILSFEVYILIDKIYLLNISRFEWYAGYIFGVIGLTGVQVIRQHRYKITIWDAMGFYGITEVAPNKPKHTVLSKFKRLSYSKKLVIYSAIVLMIPIIFILLVIAKIYILRLLVLFQNIGGRYTSIADVLGVK